MHEHITEISHKYKLNYGGEKEKRMVKKKKIT